MIGKINIDTLLADAAYQIEPKDVNAAYIEAGGGLGTFLEVCCRFAHDEDNYWDITLQFSIERPRIFCHGLMTPLTSYVI